MHARSANRTQHTQHVLVAGAAMTIEVRRSSAIVGALRLRKNWRSHIDASHSRQPLVKGERLVRYEVNAVMGCVWTGTSDGTLCCAQVLVGAARAVCYPTRVCCSWRSAMPVQHASIPEQAQEDGSPTKNRCDKQVSSWRHISCHTDKNRYYT